MNTLDLTKTRFILPADAELRTVCDLSPTLRAKLGPVEETSVVITRPGFRGTTRLVPAPMAALLEEFRVESLLTEAVMRFSQARKQDPLAVLDMVLGGLSTLSAGRVLLAGSDVDAHELAPSLRAGQSFCGIRIERLVRSLNDSEVFLGRTEAGELVALKLARDDRAGAALRNEGQVLALLEGLSVPLILAQGQDKGREWLALEWRPGTPISVAAQAARASGDRGRLLRLVTGMLDAYAEIHACGIAHGDIHPGNLIADPNDRITVLDFGQATLIAQVTSFDETRRGIPYFYDPAMAKAILAGRLTPAANVPGEQFALGTLAYLLISGFYPERLAAESKKILSRIVTDPPLPFAAHGVEFWPTIEAVLRRALAKDPADRFPDTAAFSRAIMAAGQEPRRAPKTIQPDIFELLRKGVALEGSAPPNMAWLCLRAAIAASDADLLAVADVWCSRAAPGWETSIVTAQVAGARSDWSMQAKAVAALSDALQGRTTWTPRILIQIARLLKDQTTDHPIDADAMLAFAKLCLCSPAAQLDDDEGVLHATLELQKSSTLPMSPDTIERLDRLKGGSVWLWSLAHDVFGDQAYRDRALAVELPRNPIHHGFACLRLHQLTGEMCWVEAAVKDANSSPLRPDAILLSIECAIPSRTVTLLLTGLPRLFPQEHEFGIS